MSKLTIHVSPVDTSCTEKCKYKGHGNTITSAITKLGMTDCQLACYISSVCKNFAQVLDDNGRNALHVAASCGRTALCSWMVKVTKTDINMKDQESGYTPLHRSIFYGYIDSAVLFIQMGAQMGVMDKEDLSAGDHASRDRAQGFSPHNPGQAYCWGSNSNYTLATANQHSRPHPEMIDHFRKNNISINQAAMDKFHSVFVSSSGRVWACGHGHGGRLGVGSEQTVVVPQPVRTGADAVVAVSVARNHTLLLTDGGSVWTCGSNSHHVLGHSPPPDTLLAPRALPPTVVKNSGGPLVGVAAARYHSVIWSQLAVCTFGLNGGQLGHQLLKEKTVVKPKRVMGLSEQSQIVDVAVSTGATVVGVKKGEVYLLHNYQIRRIATKILNLSKVAVYGGELNAELDPKLTAGGGEELRVLVLTTTGDVLLWSEAFPQLTRCIYSVRRSLMFCGVTLCQTNALLITQEGEAYLAQIRPKAKKKVSAPTTRAENKTDISFNQFIEKVDCHQMSITRVSNIHRAVAAAAEPKGRNFIVIQENPKVNLTDVPSVGESEYCQQMAALLETADESDALHDVIIQVDQGRVAAHHYVLSRCCGLFAALPRGDSVHIITLEGVELPTLDQALRFAYTNDCDIIHPGPHKFKNDIIKSVIDVAKKLKIPTLIKCLEQLKCVDGNEIVYKTTCVDSFELVQDKLLGSRDMLPHLYDVAIASSDGATFKAHRCVLAARLDYFNSMFTGGWVETGATTNLSLPIPQVILREVLDFLYEDEARTVEKSQDVDYISSVLVVSDQLFITRLKQICEVALTNTLSLRNAAYLLQLAITYNTQQLKSCCMQFICNNLAAVLESRILEILDSRTLQELSQYYRNMVPAMCKRFITPFTTDMSEDEMIQVANNNPVTWLDGPGPTSSPSLSSSAKWNRSSTTPTPVKKKTTRIRKSSESQRRRIESGSSNSDLDCSLDLTPTERIDFDDLTEVETTKTSTQVQQLKENKVDGWTTIDKAQKGVQNRLKVLVTASTVQPTAEHFTVLVPNKHKSQTLPGPDCPLIQNTDQFPELSSLNKMTVSSPPKMSVEVKRSAPQKLSQKQRKRLLSEGGEKAGSPPSAPTTSPAPARSAWASVCPPVIDSLADIMRSALTVGSPPREEMKFADIVADEIQQRDNWSKMKSKSLQLTQLEDKAMEELRMFYNAANIFDERITVERVLTVNIAQPRWITSRHQ